MLFASLTETGPLLPPLVVLALGILTVLTLIIWLRLNAFLALISAALLVSLLSPGALADKITRVAEAFGTSAGKVGIVIAMAAVIGQCMMESGAADRIVKAFLNFLGEKRAPTALMGSGFVLAIPVFFDTVFYLLVPLARSLHKKTRRNYLRYLVAIAAGGAITHTLVPPTPGPLLMAANLNFDIGSMMVVGAIVALPAACMGLLFASIIDRYMPVPMRPVGAGTASETDEALESATEMQITDESEEAAREAEQETPHPMPNLFLSLLPVILPVGLISADTIASTLANAEPVALVQVADIEYVGNLESTLSAAAEEEQEENETALLPNPALTVSQLLPEAMSEKLASGEELSKEELADFFNHQVIENRVLAITPDGGLDLEAWAQLPLSDDAEAMLLRGGSLKPHEAARLKRLILEATFPDSLQARNWDTPKRQAADLTALIGNANLALFLATMIAMAVLAYQRGLSRMQLARSVEHALMSGGIIILITAGGGAFGAMLTAAEVGPAIQTMFSSSGQASGFSLLWLGFGVASMLKIAQGSSTVAMITASSMLAAMITGDIELGFHPVYIGTAIGTGSLVGSWMNDSGFWIFAKMGGLTEPEALKSWTILLLILGFSGMAVTLLLAMYLPFPLGT
ncbi:Hypothetical protein PBC10988_22160 [Planctomycetales bacterium 10988]|nr:Hypothetical protein PBC10988_22160 [Planctomycetales bacterium 10988]